MQYLAKSPRPDFNNGQGNKSNSGCILSPGVYSSLTRIIPPGHSNPGQMEDTSAIMVSWWVPYLAKSPWPDFNNCPWDNLNSGRILVPGVYSSLTQIMAPLQVISILVKWKIHMSRSPHYELRVGAYLAKGPRPDFKNIPGSNSNNDHNLAPGVHLSPIRIMPPPPPPGHSNLGMLRRLSQLVLSPPV